ncbi:MAG: hypothetical protein HC811_09210 [Flammeovirgaceae bacterium]|nr:hypothetical protein [Flammeovirgaceae bacterium]
MKILLKGPNEVAKHAAWIISYCVEQHPELIQPYLSQIIRLLRTHNLPDAIKRNVMRLLQFIDIPEKFHAQVLALGFQYLTDNRESIAVQVFSITVIHKIARNHPEIIRELKTILQDLIPYKSAAFISRARRVLTSKN